MRRVFLPPPSEEELRTRPLHELIRDFPELLPLLQDLLPHLEEGGTGTLPALFSGGDLPLARLGRELAWRRRSPGTSVQESKE